MLVHENDLSEFLKAVQRLQLTKQNKKDIKKSGKQNEKANLKIAEAQYFIMQLLATPLDKVHYGLDVIGRGLLKLIKHEQ